MNPRTHYELLEVDPGASEEEVRQAYKRGKDLYAPDSIAVYTLFTDDELEGLQARLDEAYETIIDPRKRREYDLSLLLRPGSADEAPASPPPVGGEPARAGEPDDRRAPGGRAGPAPRAVDESLPADLDLGADTVFSGALLRRIREHKGVDLRDVSNHTKISLMNLRFIEDMDYAQFPAAVYVRGFLKEYARYLRLPATQVAETYMAVYYETTGRAAAVREDEA